LNQRGVSTSKLNKSELNIGFQGSRLASNTNNEAP
jgi:hypothetical protein